MKKIIALALAAAFTLPTFALTLKVGDEISYFPSRAAKKAEVTKIAPADDGVYELSLLADNGATYTFAVKEGETFTVYTRTSSKSKSGLPHALKVLSAKNNVLEVEDVSSAAAQADAK